MALKPLGIKAPSPKEALAGIAEIIEAVDNRCAAADGPVTPTNREITIEELRDIYALATLYKKAPLPSSMT